MPAFSPSLQTLLDTATEIVESVVYPLAQEVDRNASWPEHSMRAFAESGLTGLQVPARLGGHGEGLLALAKMTELISRACPSSALCFGMHCVGTAVIAAKATPQHEALYLRPIAEGRHITTLALSESGTGAHFYLPETQLSKSADGEYFLVAGTKQFVTNGGQADSYVVSTRAASTQSTELSIASHQQGFRLMDLCGLGRATLGLDLMMPGRWE
jgi:isovaleryl-CoA dehydrogenase